MRTTCTLVGDRIADAEFFLSHGEGNHKTNNTQHLVVTWDPDKGFFHSAVIELVDQAGNLYRNLNASQIANIEKFCRQYVNFYAADLEKLNATPP